MKQEQTRKYWVETMLCIANPVLEALSKRELRQKMPVEQRDFDRTPYAHLEAFGRTLCGIAPWLEAEGLTAEEAALQTETRKKVQLCIDAATDPASPDRMNFGVQEQAQPLVDAAFLAHGLVRAPQAIVRPLEDRVKRNLAMALKESRAIIPGESNWLLFSAMVETALCLLGEQDFDMLRIQYALRQFMQWYKGDSMYGDGAPFHMDYYNSFVIQPMLVDIVRFFMNQPIERKFGGANQDFTKFGEFIMARAQRYAALQERMISPEGTYPIIGRSITYRFGAFQMLAQAAQEHLLDDSINPAQVRCALTAVIKRIMDMPGVLDENGWLRPGVYGYQPGLGEQYICTGSLYLCCAVFLPLGLSPQDPFWCGENAKWTAQKVADGEDFVHDHSIPD